MPATLADLIGRVHSFDWKAWRDDFRADYLPIYQDGVRASAETAADGVARVRKADTAKGVSFDFDDPFTQHFMTEYVGQRVKQLEETTKADVIRIIRRTYDEPGDKSLAELRDQVLDTVREKFESYEEYRAERIGRTEAGYIANHGTGLLSLQADMNVGVIDGDDDEECAAANGQVWSAEKFLANGLEHPNCTRDGIPTDDAEDDA